MDGNHVVYDISSDDDDDATSNWKELSVKTSAGNNQNCDKGYDSDDVVVVGEVLAMPKRAKTFLGTDNLAAQDPHDDDDDCVVLDGDPDKPAEVKDSGLDSGGDSDDLVIVAEKGQVACRDYPHPRHLCVKFPFDSTPHADHCTLCHCYVCDSPAPCSNWGNGNLLIDHCHAIEKAELWKAERKRAKLEKSASVPSSTDGSFWRDLLDQIPAPGPPMSQNSGSHVHFPGQTSPFGLPNTLKNVSIRHGYVSNPPSRPQINPCSNIPQSARVPTSILKRPRPPSNVWNAQVNQMVGIYFSGPNQVNVRNFSHESNVVTVNLNTYPNSSATSASQILSPANPTMPSQGQVYQYSSTYIDSKLKGNMSAHISSTPNGNVSQQNSQDIAGDSYIKTGKQLPLTEDQSDYDTNAPDFGNSDVDTKFFDDLLYFDFEADKL